jgi:hypothetical protein
MTHKSHNYLTFFSFSDYSWPWMIFTLLNNLFFFPMAMEFMPTTTTPPSTLYHWPNGFSSSPCGLYSLHGLLSFFSFLQTSGPGFMMTGLMLPVEAYLGRQVTPTSLAFSIQTHYLSHSSFMLINIIVSKTLTFQGVPCSYTAAQLSLLLFLLFHIFSSLGNSNYNYKSMWFLYMLYFYMFLFCLCYLL